MAAAVPPPPRAVRTALCGSFGTLAQRRPPRSEAALRHRQLQMQAAVAEEALEVPDGFTLDEVKIVVRIQRWWKGSNARKFRYVLFKCSDLYVRGGNGIDDSDCVMDFKYWIEAADPKHRYGSQLHPYYLQWLESGTRQAFFNWLDYGHGKDLDLETSPRHRLTSSRVTYFSPRECSEYEVVFVRNGDGQVLLHWKLDSRDGSHKQGAPVNTPRQRALWLYRLGWPTKYIFAVDMEYRLYVHEKVKGRFHHSSFLSGRPCRAAGGIVIENGVLLAVTGNSGHYKPTPRMLDGAFRHFEQEHGLDRGSYILAHPRTRKLLGPCTPGCVVFEKLRLPSNFPW